MNALSLRARLIALAALTCAVAVPAHAGDFMVRARALYLDPANESTGTLDALGGAVEVERFAQHKRLLDLTEVHTGEKSVGALSPRDRLCAKPGRCAIGHCPVRASGTSGTGGGQREQAVDAFRR